MKYAKNYIQGCINGEKVEIERLTNKVKKDEWEETKLKSVTKLVAELEEALNKLGDK